MDEIKHTREIYSYLHLSPEQANAVYQMDQEKMTLGLNREYFSHWEERDYQHDRWKVILNADQLLLYTQRQDENDTRHEEWLVQTDVERAKEVPFREEWVTWLNEVFVPGLRRLAMQTGILFVIEREKINYLRQEYTAYLQQDRQSILVRHYRHSRRFQPNTLALALLRHEEMRAMPNYLFFIEQADAAVTAVADFLLDRFKPSIREKAEFFREQFAASGEHAKVLRKQHFGEEEPRKGWQATIYPRTELQEGEISWMTYLLMDGVDLHPR